MLGPAGTSSAVGIGTGTLGAAVIGEGPAVGRHRDGIVLIGAAASRRGRAECCSRPPAAANGAVVMMIVGPKG